MSMKNILWFLLAFLILFGTVATAKDTSHPEYDIIYAVPQVTATATAASTTAATTNATAPATITETNSEMTDIETKYVGVVKYYNAKLPEDKARAIARSILDYSSKNYLDPRLFVAIIALESKFQPMSVDRKTGQFGLMRITKPLARKCKVDDKNIYDIQQNISCGIKTFKDCYSSHTIDNSVIGVCLADYDIQRKINHAKRKEHYKKVADLYRYYVKGEMAKPK
jgi:membrane-bound lytic murein transglycosylase MltF